MKRFLSLLLVMTMIFAVLPLGATEVEAISPSYAVSSSYASSSYYSALCNVSLTGNQRDDIINVALSQVGYREGDYAGDYSGADDSSYNNYTEYNYWYHNYISSGMPVGGSSAPWCATFVSWCAAQANISTSILKRSTAAGHGSSYFNVNFYSGSSTLASSADNDSYFKGYNYTPRKGDLFFTRSWSHVGLVVGVSGSKVITVEGNTNNNGSSQGNGVYKLTWRNISDLYFGVPNYTETTHAINSSYGTNFTAYPKAKITAENIFDANHSQVSTTAWIGTSDLCTIHEVYTDGCCMVSYPLDSGGTRTVYSRISLFNVHTCSYSSSITKNATCTATGVRTYSCSCGSSYTESIPALGHDYTGARLQEPEHPHPISQRCVRYSVCGGFIWTGENGYSSDCSSCCASTPTIRWWISDSEYGDTVSEYKVGNRYYFCYRLYDKVSGNDWDDVKSSNYTVNLTFYNPDGSVKYTNVNVFDYDQSWISSFFSEAGTYKIGVVVSGDYSFEGSREFYVAPNPKEIHSSTNSVTLTLGGTETAEIYVWTSGYYDGSAVLNCSQNNGHVTWAWGEWNADGVLPLYITAFSQGTTTLMLSVKDKETSAVLHSIPVTVTVDAKTYQITYNANGGTSAPSNQIKYHNTDLTLSDTIPTRVGYKFLGWSTSSSAASATYSAGAAFSANANTTLYAVWKVNTYTITYNANGGTGAPSSQKKDYGKSITLSTEIPTRSGYTFLGWSASSSATSATYQPGSDFTSNATTTLYAVWQKDASSGYAEGDVNGDGKVNMFDYAVVKSYYLGKASLTVDQIDRADVNGDGKINMFDYVALKSKVMGG